MKPWMPLVAAMALATGLAGCGNGDDEPAPAEVEEMPEEASPPAAETDEASSAEAPEEAPVAEPEETGGTLEAEGEVDAEGELDLEAEGEVDAEAETLGESPADTLEEGAALPGETTRSDVDAIIEETERRFEEASRRIDEQFESAEEVTPELEPMEASPDFEPMEAADYESDIGLDEASGSELDEREALPGESTSSDIDAILEETEKRFEEASRRIDEQFEEAERQAPGSASELDALDAGETESTTD